MSLNTQIHSLCGEISGRLEELARARCRGVLSEERFVELLLRIEEEAVKPANFNLTASNTIDDWTVFNLRVNGSEEVCASFEFLPETGEFRQPGSGPE